MINITVRYVDGLVVQPDGRTAVLTAHTTTVYRGASGPATDCWHVEWRLVLEDGAWRRDTLRQERDASCATHP